MERSSSTSLLIIAIVLSFVGGFLCRSAMIFDSHSADPRLGEAESLRQEATGFFYDTMRGLFFEDTSRQRYASQYVLDVFKEYRPRLEPRCWLINVYPSYGSFYGEVLFSSGDIFEVRMEKTDGAWQLEYFHHLGTEHFYHDLRDERKKEG